AIEVVGSGAPIVAARERPHVVGGGGLAADAPIAAWDLFDEAPRGRAHALALDRNHSIREVLDHRALLGDREDAADELHLDEKHCVSLSGPVRYRPSCRRMPCGTSGRPPDIGPRTFAGARHTAYN